jgi:hypothetical protein
MAVAVMVGRVVVGVMVTRCVVMEMVVMVMGWEALGNRLGGGGGGGGLGAARLDDGWEVDREVSDWVVVGQEQEVEKQT